VTDTLAFRFVMWLCSRGITPPEHGSDNWTALYDLWLALGSPSRTTPRSAYRRPRMGESVYSIRLLAAAPHAPPTAKEPKT